MPGFDRFSLNCMAHAHVIELLDYYCCKIHLFVGYMFNNAKTDVLRVLLFSLNL